MQNELSLAWPPPYTIKRHPRAKRVKLKASQQKGLELIVPPNFNIKHVAKILVEHQAWIKKQLLKLASLDQSDEDELPTQISLPALDQVWSIDYIASNTTLQLIARPHQQLVVMGNIQHKKNCKKLLATWVKKMAELHLPITLKEISLAMKLSYTRVSIRGQQTRWGSCSHDKTISLNYKLLFLPLHLMEHVLIHELCHLVHLDHSEKFWRLVAKFDAKWEENRRALRSMSEMVPRWVE